MKVCAEICDFQLARRRDVEFPDMEGAVPTLSEEVDSG